MLSLNLLRPAGANNDACGGNRPGMRRRQHLSALLLHSAGLTIGMCSWCHVLVLLALLGAGAKAGCPLPPERVSLPNATSSGYLEGIDDQGSRLFFLFYEAQQSDRVGRHHSRVPITLWLQARLPAAGR